MTDAVDTYEFRSPLSLDRTSGTTPLSDDTPSKMVLFLNKDATGYIEWECEEFDMHEEIGLRFAIDPKGKRTLTDYDGVFAIPDQALDLLERNGIDVADMRKAMAD